MNKISICDHGYSQKSEMWKHPQSVHSKDRPKNCSNCEFSSSRMDILERHVNHFFKDLMSQKLVKVVAMIFLKKSIWKSILNQFIYRKGWTRSLSVIKLILKKVKCENIPNLFIQKIGHIIAQIVSLVLLEWTFWKYISIIF